MGQWIITSKYKNKLTSLESGSFKGINDHNLVIDRKYADTLFRGITEDYYFNETLENVHWGNAEKRISQLANAYNIPQQVVSICEEPLIPLRGLVNESYWRMHPLYVRHFIQDCNNLANINSNEQQVGNRRLKSKSKSIWSKHTGSLATSNSGNINTKSCCDQKWLELLNEQSVPVITSNQKVLLTNAVKS